MIIGLDVLYYGNRELPPLPAKVTAELEDGMCSLLLFTASAETPVVVVESAAYCKDDLDDFDFNFNFFTSIGRTLTPKPVEHVLAKMSADATLARIDELKRELDSLTGVKS